MKNRIGIIADDFTGASDAASFLTKSGNKTILLTKLPKILQTDAQCVVIALKIRSVEVKQAIREVSRVVDFFEENQIDQIYYKYCSTFDSTKKGNIGPVLDYLLERKKQKYTILCPSLPVNGRTVKNGILKVNGVPLSESTMKDHPLNPMWDSYIPTLMKEQSKYPCYPLSVEILSSKEKLASFLEGKKEQKHFYLIPDYTNDQEGKLISKCFGELPILSGGSGLLEHFHNSDYYSPNTFDFDLSVQKPIIVCGSCSEMTRRQVNAFKLTNNCAYAIDANALIRHEIKVEQYLDIVENNLPKASLVYSNGCEIQLQKDSLSFQTASRLMEEFLSQLVYKASQKSFNKIIVAGGETSGAVTILLGYSSFYVGESVAPGVPVLIPMDNTKIRLILKSGNFGDEDFFIKALGAK